MGEWFFDTFFGWIYDIFYTLQKSICYLLDFIRDIFCKLAGIETVKIDGGEEEILTHFITSPAIQNAFLGVLLVEQAAEKSRVTFGSVAKGATRLATLPAGMLKDMIQGGVITAGKNFIPRVRNIVQGNSAVNHAVVRRPIEKVKSTDKKENKKE